MPGPGSNQDKEDSKESEIRESPINFFSAYANYTFWRTEKLDIRVHKKDATPNPYSYLDYNNIDMEQYEKMIRKK